MLPRLTPRKQEHRHLCMICVTQTSQHFSLKPAQGTFTDFGVLALLGTSCMCAARR